MREIVIGFIYSIEDAAYIGFENVLSALWVLFRGTISRGSFTGMPRKATKGSQKEKYINFGCFS